MTALTGKQARFLRGLGHHLDPVVMIGRAGMTDNLVAQTDKALETHELIKLKVQEGCELDRKQVASELAAATGSAVAQVLGRTFLLYRRAMKPVIELP